MENAELVLEILPVLVHSNFEAKGNRVLFRSGLPAVVFTDLSLFETGEQKRHRKLLQGLANADDDRAVKRAWLRVSPVKVSRFSKTEWMSRAMG